MEARAEITEVRGDHEVVVVNLRVILPVAVLFAASIREAQIDLDLVHAAVGEKH